MRVTDIKAGYGQPGRRYLRHSQKLLKADSTRHSVAVPPRALGSAAQNFMSSCPMSYHRAMCRSTSGVELHLRIAAKATALRASRDAAHLYLKVCKVRIQAVVAMLQQCAHPAGGAGPPATSQQCLWPAAQKVVREAVAVQARHFHHPQSGTTCRVPSRLRCTHPH